MNKNKRQHYVPQGYLKNFAISNGKDIWVYDKESLPDQYLKQPKSIKSVCHGDYFYRFNGSDIIDEQINKFENNVIPLLGEIKPSGTGNSIQLNDKQRQDFSMFLAFQIVRTQSYRDEININRIKDIENILYAPEFLANNPPPAILNDTIQNKEIDISIENIVSLDAMMKAVNPIYMSIINKNWEFFTIDNIFTDKEIAFVSSDNPAFYYNQLGDMGASHNLSQIIWPIRKDLALVVTPFDNDNLWWFKTKGKGNKERIVSVSSDMLKAFKRYRKSLGLTSLPSPGEKAPLVPKLTGNGAMKSIRTIRSLVQECFDRSAQRLISDNHEEEAEQVMAATAHWLRHTGISDDVKHRPREHVRDDAGHGSGAITDKYIDVEKRERNSSARRKKIIPECMEN